MFVLVLKLKLQFPWIRQLCCILGSCSNCSGCSASSSGLQWIVDCGLSKAPDSCQQNNAIPFSPISKWLHGSCLRYPVTKYLCHSMNRRFGSSQVIFHGEIDNRSFPVLLVKFSELFWTDMICKKTIPGHGKWFADSWAPWYYQLKLRHNVVQLEAAHHLQLGDPHHLQRRTFWGSLLL